MEEERCECCGEFVDGCVSSYAGNHIEIMEVSGPITKKDAKKVTIAQLRDIMQGKAKGAKRDELGFAEYKLVLEEKK